MEPIPSRTRAAIIVADDDAALRAVIAEVLDEAGFFVVTAATGDEVVGLLAKGLCPNLIVCDLLMPGMGVPELLVRLGQSARTRETPVAIMTGSREDHVPDAAYVLRKRFTLSELVELASRTCERPSTSVRTG